jgi:hypothetical protein
VHPAAPKVGQTLLSLPLKLGVALLIAAIGIRRFHVR